MVNRVQTESELLGLKINKSKIKVIKISKTPSTISIKLNDSIIEQVKNRKDLGTLVNDKLDTETEIKSRKNKQGKSFIKWKNLLCNRKLNIEMRPRTLKRYVWPILLYGVEVWTIKPTMRKKLEAIEMWFYRRLFKVS